MEKVEFAKVHRIDAYNINKIGVPQDSPYLHVFGGNACKQSQRQKVELDKKGANSTFIVNKLLIIPLLFLNQ